MTSVRMRTGFLVSVAGILVLTALLKCVTLLNAAGNSPPLLKPGFLDQPAPYIPGWTIGEMMRIAVVFELGVAFGLRWLRTDHARLTLVALVGGLFAAYHLGMSLIGYRQPCGCLGGPLDWLHLSRRAYDTLTLVIVAYFLLGSYGFLLADAIQSFRVGSSCRAPEPRPPEATN